MPNFQQTIIIGHMGSDPDVRYANNGNPVANFSVAVTEKWKDKSTGDKREETEWYRCVCFGPSVENYVAKYLHKGDAVQVIGKMKTRKWQDKEGKDRYSTELVCDRFSGVQGLSRSSGGQRSQTQPAQSQGGASQDFNDDVPFRAHMAGAEYLV